jgi:tetratricopeptide (TPR) repeat protein
MLKKYWYLRGVLAAAAWLPFTFQSATGQDLVAVSSLGSSSVFVFRSRASVKRVTVSKPTRTKEQRMESVANIKKQYTTLAKAAPDKRRAKIVDPNTLGPKGGRDLPPAQASKLFSGVGEYYVDKGDYDQSFEFFRDAIRLDEKNEAAKLGFSEALALKGNDMLVKEQGSAAKGLFLEAIKYNPKNSAAYFGLGEVYSETDSQAEAIAAYEKSLENDRDLTEIYVPLGILYYQAGDMKKANELLTKALATAPNNAETQFFLGMIRASEGDDVNALAGFQKARTIDANYADAYYNVGETLARLKRPAEAIPEYQKAISLKANYLDAIVGLGQALYEIGKFAEAIDQLKAAAKLKNDNWETFAALADAYRGAGDYNNAIANYNLASLFLTRQPNFNKETAADLYSKAGYSIGKQCEINMAKFVKCQWPGAVIAMQKAVDLSGSQLDYANLGWAYYNAASDGEIRGTAAGQAKLVLAKEALLKGIVGNPIVADGAYQNLGGVLVDQGDFKGAIDALNMVVTKHPDWSFSRYALGTAYFKTNDFNNAAKWFQAVVDAEPNYVPALASLGYAQIRLKNGKEVKKIVDRLKALNPVEAGKLEREMKVAKLG